MTSKPRILLTNDDGIYADGIAHLYRSLQEFAEVTVVAPAAEQSGRGLGITIYHPLRCHKVQWRDCDRAWAIEGTPVDCVKMALTTLMEEKPDLVIAGINAGSNAGRNLLYSGTVGTTIEGALKGIPGIAFSCVDSANPPFEEALPYIRPVVDHVLQQPLPESTILNVNFPSRKAGPIKGIRIARQGSGYWTDAPMERLDHNGVRYYWLGGKLEEKEEHPESDLAYLQQGYAAAVPVQVNDLTHLTELHARHEAFQNLAKAEV